MVKVALASVPRDPRENMGRRKPCRYALCNQDITRCALSLLSACSITKLTITKQ